MTSSKGFGKAILFLGAVALLGVFLVPRLPELMMAAGITGEATGGTVQQLEVGTPSINDVNLDGTIELEIPVRNPNSFNAKVDRISYTVYVDDKEVTSGTTQQGVTIPANSRGTVTDRIEVDIGGALGAGVGTLGNALAGEDTYLRVDGKLHVDVGPTTFDIPFSREKPL